MRSGVDSLRRAWQRAETLENGAYSMAHVSLNSALFWAAMGDGQAVIEHARDMTKLGSELDAVLWTTLGEVYEQLGSRSPPRPTSRPRRSRPSRQRSRGSPARWRSCCTCTGPRRHCRSAPGAGGRMLDGVDRRAEPGTAGVRRRGDALPRRDRATARAGSICRCGAGRRPSRRRPLPLAGARRSHRTRPVVPRRRDLSHREPPTGGQISQSRKATPMSSGVPLVAPSPVTASRPNIAVLGGGMAGLAAAWHLSRPPHRDRIDEITVYQRGWRLGGKGASGRGVHGRIEEHGLHVWLGYYDNAFRLMRECYDELDRPATEPECPIRTWRDAFVPAPRVGVEEPATDEWRHWIGVVRPTTCARRTARGLTPHGRRRRWSPAPARVNLVRAFVAVAGWARPELAAGAALAARREAISAAVRAATVRPAPTPRVLDRWALAAGLRPRCEDDRAARRPGTSSIGARPDRGAHRRRPADRRRLPTIDRPRLPGVARPPRSRRGDGRGLAFVRGLYDLVFGFAAATRTGRRSPPARHAPRRPRCSSTTRARSSGRCGPAWATSCSRRSPRRCGARGVRFEFFHRVDALHPRRRPRTRSVTIGRQVASRRGRPVRAARRVGGLPCFPATPLLDQLDACGRIWTSRWSRIWCTWPDAKKRVLRRRRDFDDLVFAIPPGMAPGGPAGISPDSARWKGHDRGERDDRDPIAAALAASPTTSAVGWTGRARR